MRYFQRIISTGQSAAVTSYQANATRKRDFEWTELAKKKPGIFTGVYAINPLNQSHIPIWVDYAHQCVA